MTNKLTSQMKIDEASTDVFAAARWLNLLWNSSVKAVSAYEIEWQCNTWGSGRGGGDWLETSEPARAGCSRRTARRRPSR